MKIQTTFLTYELSIQEQGNPHLDYQNYRYFSGFVCQWSDDHLLECNIFNRKKWPRKLKKTHDLSQKYINHMLNENGIFYNESQIFISVDRENVYIEFYSNSREDYNKLKLLIPEKFIMVL